MSRAQWNIIAQQVMVTRWDLGPVGDIAFQTPLQNLYNVDAWDGYPAARDRLFKALADYRPSNPVVLTGDIHSAWAANLLQDFSDPNSDALAAEFVCSSISSTFGDDNAVVVNATIPANPQIRYFNGFKRLHDVRGHRGSLRGGIPGGRRCPACRFRGHNRRRLPAAIRIQRRR